MLPDDHTAEVVSLDKHRRRAVGDGATAGDVVPADAQDVDNVVYEGEIVDDGQDQARGGEVAERPSRLPVPWADRPADDVAWAVAQTALRAGWTVGRGHAVWVRRLIGAATYATYREQIRAARAAGDAERLAEWIDRYRQAKRDRWDRIATAPKTVLAALQVVGLVLALVLAVLVVVGVAVAMRDGGWTWGTWWGFVGDMLAAVGVLVQVVLVGAVIVGPVAWLIAAYRAGQGEAVPAWLGTSTDADIDATIDETTIAQALLALRIPQITDHIKRDKLPLQYLTPCRRDGRGTHAVLRLPNGVTAEKIARRRADLATGLHRLAKEVWPTTGDEAGILDLWVADKGALAEGAGPYPLLDDGLVDVFKGVPFGKTLRGDPIVAPVMERNTIVGGMPGQGKSAAARVIMAGAALDPTAELRIWVPDTNFDFEVFQPRCSRYVMGADREDIEQILQDLRDLHAEVQARGDLLVKYETPAVTRELADRGIGLHPLFCLLEEAHVAITDKEHGAEISGLLVDIVRLGRKRGIHMIVSTQAPTKDSMPRDVTRNCSNGIAFAVGDHVANDALLGQGAYRAGHRATDLIPGTDRGTAVVKGFSGERSEMVQAYFLSVARGNDQVTPLIERSLAEIERRGRPVPGTDRARPEVQQRDLLDDLDEVLGAERVRLADVPALLRELAPDWVPYRKLTGKQLGQQLDDLGVKVPRPGNVPQLDPAEVRRVIAQRATADLDGRE